MTDEQAQAMSPRGQGHAWSLRGEQLFSGTGCSLSATCHEVYIPLNGFKNRADSSVKKKSAYTACILAVNLSNGDRRLVSGWNSETRSQHGNGEPLTAVSQVLPEPNGCGLWAVSSNGLIRIDPLSGDRHCIAPFTPAEMTSETGERGGQALMGQGRRHWSRSLFSLILGPIAHYLPFGLGNIVRQAGAYRFAGQRLMASLPMAGHAPKKLLKSNHIQTRETMAWDEVGKKAYFSFSGGGGAGVLAYEFVDQRWSVVSYHGIVEQLHRGSGFRNFSSPLTGLLLYQQMLYGYSSEADAIIRIDPDDGERQVVSDHHHGEGPRLHGGCQRIHQDHLICVGVDEQQRLQVTKVNLDSGQRTALNLQCAEAQMPTWPSDCCGITPHPEDPQVLLLGHPHGIIALNLETQLLSPLSTSFIL